MKVVGIKGIINQSPYRDRTMVKNIELVLSENDLSILLVIHGQLHTYNQVKLLLKNGFVINDILIGTKYPELMPELLQIKNDLHK